jgi:hypothetical protein
MHYSNLAGKMNWFQAGFYWLMILSSLHAALPSITSHPVDTHTYDGRSMQFNVTASGGTLTYQWRKNGIDLSGKTTATLDVSNAITAADAGLYDCVVTNADGNSFHPAAMLTVQSGVAPILRQNALAQVEVAGDSSTISAAVYGSGPVTYQWMKNGVDISGATAPSYNINPSAAQATANYSVRVTNPYGSTVGATTFVTIHARQQPNIYGVPFVKIADTKTIKPSRPGVQFNKFSKPRLRDGKLYFLAEDGSLTENGLYLYQNNTLSIVADESMISPDGAAYVNISYPTEETSGSMAFVAGTGNTATGNSLAKYQNGGAVTFLARFGDPAPNGSEYFSFYGLGKSGSQIYCGMTAYTPGGNPARTTLSHWNGSSFTEILTQGDAMPSGGLFHALSGTTAQLAYDGSNIVFFASTNTTTASGVYHRAASTGTMTRLLSQTNTPNLDIDGAEIILGIPPNVSPNVFGKWTVMNTSGTVLSTASVGGGTYLVDAAGATSHAKANDSRNFSIVRNGQSSRWSNLSSQSATTTLFGSPSINAVKDISAHEKSVALVLGHSLNAQNITDSMWLAHNSATATAPPVIVFSPQDSTLTEGSAIPLRVLATGGGLSWQWQKNGSPVAGNTDGELLIDSFTDSHVGSWTVTVTNGMGTATASFQLNKVNTVVAPIILQQPLSRHVLAGLMVFFSAPMDVGSGTPTYQWYKNGITLSNQTNSSLVLSSAQEADEGTYHVIATNSAGSTSSSSVTLQVGLDVMDIAKLIITKNGSDAGLTFLTVIGHSYRLERSDTLLSGDWTVVETFTGDGNHKSWSYPIGTTKRFYRVARISPP